MAEFLDAPSPDAQGRELAYQVADWQTWVWEKRDPEKGQFRYYRLSLQQALWGHWEILRSWGRIGHRPTRVVQTFVASPQAAAALVEQVRRTRLRRGYR
ncbi:WGR domain-containing protein [Acidithiobacillus sp. IBUN Pt1247-S3]|uniref:WGR domain-containing protein n=1 Tax=Acidithiobacillus sp. IBUN Pt1247-S3 TaxID=3166642 RepID=UPI0034E5C5CB